MRTILHLAASNDWSLHQYDVKTTFLNRILPEEEIQFMEQPPGSWKRELHLAFDLWTLWDVTVFDIWNQALHALFLGLGFRCFNCKWCIYSHRLDNGNLTVIVVHVDNMLVASSSEKDAGHFQTELEVTWKISALGEPKLIVGIALCRNRATRTIALSQTVLIDKIVTTYGQGDAKLASTPMVHGVLLRRPIQTVYWKTARKKDWIVSLTDHLLVN